MSEVIVITSGKGGVGKTTTTANIGCGLAKEGQKVLMIDTDIGLTNLDIIMGLENRIVYTIVDVVKGICDVNEALIKDKRYPTLYLLPAAQTSDKTAVSPEDMEKLISDLGNEFDIILIDCPAGIGQGFKNAVAGAGRAVVVTTPEVSAMRDADRIIGLLEQDDMFSVDLIVNRIRPKMVLAGDMMSGQNVVDILNVNLLGIVPDDESIIIATNKGEPVVELDTPAGIAYRNIAGRILGNRIPLMSFEQDDSSRGENTGFLGRLFKRKSTKD